MLIKKANKLTSFIMAICISLTITFNNIYEIKNFNHKCSNNECPICNNIKQIQNNNYKLLMSLTNINFILIPLIIIFFTLHKIYYLVLNITPVKLKVRMDN